jgi:hypothetical protein
MGSALYSLVAAVKEKAAAPVLWKFHGSQDAGSSEVNAITMSHELA